jgi:hypothetical protein
MFTRTQDYTEDPQALVCVLNDEVESLTHAWQSLVGTEPSDMLREVNALLTQIDLIQKYSNCHDQCSFILYYMHFTRNLQMSINK